MLFKEVLGHTELKEKFIQDIRSNSVAHALMFVGDVGYGGLPLALAYVQYLLCENKGETDSCGECANCRNIEKLEHPDVHFTFPTVQANSKLSDPQFPLWKEAVLKNPYLSLNEWIHISDERGRRPIISVDQSADIIRKLTLKSYGGGHKVSIIWMAEEMNTSCANKLLKIIEEPPADTLFILLADSDDMILPTILSRTQITRIKPLQDEELQMHLLNSHQVTNELAHSITARAGGSLSLALELINSSGNQNSNFQRFVELMRVGYKKDVLAMLDWSEGMNKLGREEQKNFLRYALYMVRQSLIKNYTEDKLNKTSTDEAGFLNNFARFITGNNVQEFNDLFNNAHYHIERNAHGKLVFTNITFEVMRYIHRA